MSPGLSEALENGDVSLALKRLYNHHKLRALGAPQVIIDSSSVLLDKSRDVLGARFDDISAALFVEFKEMEDAAVKAEQDWESRCESCLSWTGGFSNQRDDESWCARYLYSERTAPDECPSYECAKDGT